MTRFLAACRYLLVIPIIGCVLLTAGIVVMGMGRILITGTELVRNGDMSAKAAKMMSLAAIEIIDLFLIATVSYITAVGLYKLFISNSEIELPVRLNINSLKNLENKIIGVIVAALAVAFFGQVVATSDLAALLHYGGGIALMIAALAFFMRQGDKENETDG
jgi:uncharacterized membrane protein YqhA